MKQTAFLLIVILAFGTGLFKPGAFAAKEMNAENGKYSETIQWVDITAKQIRIMRAAENLPKEKRNRLLADSIFAPYITVWNGYLGDETAFLNWLNNTAYNELDEYERKLEVICTKEMQNIFFEAVEDFQEFSGYSPQGKWFVFFGPKWTNLGGLGDGTMLIDMASYANTSLEKITRLFAHEINHQVYKITSPPRENAVLYRILDEGFACYVSYLFHNGNTTIARELSYSEAAYQACRENDARIIELLREHYQSNDNQLSRLFANRQHRFYDDLPGAIGYYIGFRIVEEYVKRHGADSWKDIYTMKPEEVLMKSEIFYLHQ